MKVSGSPCNAPPVWKHHEDSSGKDRPALAAPDRRLCRSGRPSSYSRVHTRSLAPQLTVLVSRPVPPRQVASLPLPEDWSGLLHRTKRSLLWRWNSMKPLGTSCREHSECGTKYCRYRIKHPGYLCSVPLKFCCVQWPKAAPPSFYRKNICSFYISM